jgi:hypothetical protein
MKKDKPQNSTEYSEKSCSFIKNGFVFNEHIRMLISNYELNIEDTEGL